MQDKTFYTVPGEFVCQKCSEKVNILRFWYDTLDLTWQCSKKHISKVSLDVKKIKKNKKASHE
jgi:hypothetical protein